MAYATVAQLSQLGMTTAALAGIPGSTKDEALRAASALADSYIGSVYVLPLNSWGDDLRRAVVAIAVYDIMASRGFNPEGNDQIIVKRYDDAIAWLKGVGSGTVTPGGIDDSGDDVDDPPDAGEVFVVTDPRRVW